jgi:capsid protein
MHALFITTPAPAEPLDPAEGRDENGERTIDLQPGQITMLEPGEEVQTSAPAESGQTYEPFQYRTLLQVSAALGVPYAYLSNDMLKANYSNSRLALLEFRRRIEAYQHAVIVWQLCRQVWARWMDTAVLAGALDLPGYDQRRREYLACGWLPPKWDWVDPLKDARAEIEQIDAGLKSRTQALAERGYDAEQVDTEIAADKAREQSLGLNFQSAAASAPLPADTSSAGEANNANGCSSAPGIPSVRDATDDCARKARNHSRRARASPLWRCPGGGRSRKRSAATHVDHRRTDRRGFGDRDPCQSLGLSRRGERPPGLWRHRGRRCGGDG